MVGTKAQLIFAVAAFALLPTKPSIAQSRSEWSGVAKQTNGNCGDGALAHVTESTGKMNVRFFINGKQTSEVTVPLKPDGSGTASWKGQLGRQTIEVQPGTGKRTMKSAQLDGTCAWTWRPQ
jgi:hypothetical protein